MYVLVWFIVNLVLPNVVVLRRIGSVCRDFRPARWFLHWTYVYHDVQVRRFGGNDVPELGDFSNVHVLFNASWTTNSW